MIQLEELRTSLLGNKDELTELRGALDLEKGAQEAAELEKKTAAPGFWDQPEQSQKVLQRIKQLKDKAARYETLEGLYQDTLELIDMALEEGEEGLYAEVQKDYDRFQAMLEEEKLSTLLKGEYDKNNAIMSFHAGAGGTEAQDWTGMLYRMYTHWAESRGFRYKILDYIGGEEAGVKSADILVEGENAFGYLKGEMGVHRLVRVSPFDASGRRHTSFAAVEVMPEMTDDVDIEIRPEDLKVDTYRSGGAGGQHVNKTESAIRITHLPTGLVVECQDERSQHKNKDRAMKILRTKLYEMQQAALDKERASERRSQVGSGDRSERVRTYNYPQGRVTDHRIGLTLHRLDAVLNGDLDEIIDALTAADQAEKLRAGGDASAV